MGWNDILTIFNTVDTFLGLFIIVLTAERAAVWFNRGRKWLHNRKSEGGRE